MGLSMESILVIDDDRELCKYLAEYFEPDGIKVDEAHDVEKGIEMILCNDYSIVLLDIMLPGRYDGFDVLRNVRAKTDIPVIVLATRGEVMDRIIALEIGADDYLSKPFNPRELLARIHAVLRRSASIRQNGAANMTAKKYRFGDVVMDMGARMVLRNNKPVKLTQVEFSILEILMRNYGRVVSREELSQEVLGRPFFPNNRSIDVHVSNIRKKLGIEHEMNERIVAIRGTGYVYVCSPSPSDE